MGFSNLSAVSITNSNCAGFGIEPGEVEHALAEHAAILQAVVAVPSVFVQLQDLPANPNGKVDRRARRTRNGSVRAFTPDGAGPIRPSIAAGQVRT
jgi:hypothetical protein